MEENYGPKLEVIPEQRYYTCHGCKYYQHMIIKSGFRPEYDSVCTKMNMFAEVLNENELN